MFQNLQNLCFSKFSALEIMFLFYKGFYEGSKISDPKIENIK